MMHSARDTAGSPLDVSVYCYLDNDDPTREQYPSFNVTKHVGRRRLLSDCWNILAERALETSDQIFMLGNDDLVFETPDWDWKVEEVFRATRDRIAYVHGSDEGQHFDKFGSLGFLSRQWINAVGYFAPPYFPGDGVDHWINDVATAIGRRVYVPIVTRHLHPLFKSAPDDRTYQERREREANQPEKFYESLEAQREADIVKLRAVITK